MLKVLVTDGANKNSLAIVRNLDPKEYTADVLSPLPKKYSLCYYSKFTNRFFNSRSSTDDIDEYAEELIEILGKDHYDVLIPVGLNSNIAASKFKSEICSLVHCLIPDWNMMEIAANKDRTMEHARKNDVPIPETIPLVDRNSLNDVISFPCVVKSSDGSKEYVRYCNNKEELVANYQYLLSKSRTTIICQEYVRGFGCGFFGVYKDGKLEKHFLHKRLKEFPITGGSSAVAESYFDERLLKEGMKICDSLKWNGPIMAEFKYSFKDDQYKLIELNPKLWGSLDLTIRAGVNVPEILIRLAMNRQIESDNTYKDIRFRWIFPDEIKVLASQLSSHNIREFFRNDSRTVTNFDLEDPLPTMFQMGRGLSDGLRLAVDERLRFTHGRQEPLEM
jgi:predicted ATP-grasp superfamily ATP-dependent carboligase